MPIDHVYMSFHQLSKAGISLYDREVFRIEVTMQHVAQPEAWQKYLARAADRLFDHLDAHNNAAIIVVGYNGDQDDHTSLDNKGDEVVEDILRFLEANEPRFNELRVYWVYDRPPRRKPDTWIC